MPVGAEQAGGRLENSARGSPWLLTLLALGMAGTVAGLADFLWLWVLSEAGELGGVSRLDAVRYCAALGTLLGLTLALPVLVWLLLRKVCWKSGGEQGTRLEGLLVWASLVALFVWLNRATFQGVGIRNAAGRDLWRWLFYGGGALLILGLSVWARRYLQRSRGRGWKGPATFCVGAALVVFVLNGRFYRGLYGGLHLQLALGTLLLVGLAVYPLILRLRLLGRWGVLCVLLAVATQGGLLRQDPRLAPVRGALAAHAVNLKPWLPLAEFPIRFLWPLPKARVISMQALLQSRRPDAALKRRVTRKLDAFVPGRRKLSLLLLSVDSLRDDCCSWRGAPRGTTPKMAALAAQGVVFPKTYTAYPASSYAYSALFSGRYANCTPARALAHNARARFPKDLVLAGILAQHGFRSAAETAFSLPAVRRRGAFGHLRLGFQSFSMKLKAVARDGALVAEALLGRLKLLGSRRFFLWGHFMDPHAPYRHHQGLHFGEGPRGRYAGEVAYADRQVGRVLAGLKTCGRDQDTVVVLMSDHGQEFREHGMLYHDSDLYETQMRVPLVLRVPGVGHRVVEGPVGLVDLLPTLLELFQIPDAQRRSGVSLWPRILGLDPGKPMAFGELFPSPMTPGGRQEMVVLGHLKMIRNLTARTEEIFDLSQDPAEGHNLLGSLRGEESARLRGLLAAVDAQQAAIRRGSRKVPPSGGRRAALLSALEGYWKAQPDQRARFRKQLRDQLFQPESAFWDRFGELLQAPLTRWLGDWLQALLQVKEAFFVRRSLLQVAGLEPFSDHYFAPSLKHSQRVLLQTRELLLRAALGYADGLEWMRFALRMSGAPDKHFLAALIQMHGRIPHTEAHLAGLVAPDPAAIAIILGGLKHRELDLFFDALESLLDHPLWQSERLRIQIVHLLEGFRMRGPHDPRRQRRVAVLVKLARGGNPRVAAAALQVLQELVGTDLPPGSLSHVHLQKESPKRSSQASFSARLHEPLKWELVRLEVEPRYLPKQWAWLRISVKNTGTRPWPGSGHFPQIWPQPLFLNYRGQPLPGAPGKTPGLVRGATAPGEIRVAYVPFTTPRWPGPYTIALRLVSRLVPGGATLSGPLRRTKVIFHVRRRIL